MALIFQNPKHKHKPKYGNHICYDEHGNKFDSAFELKRWKELQILERVGEIKDLKRQIPFDLEAHGQPICTYIADFVYTERGAKVVEDAKGVETPDFKIKAKLFQAQYKQPLRITYAK